MACQCVNCPECNGSGHVWLAFDGEYLGNHRCDDMDSMEACEDCRGSGLSEVCDECIDDRDREQDELDEFNARYDWWEGLTPQQRNDHIRRAMDLG